MDPLSVTASLIAVIQVAGAVVSACYEYRQGFKGQHKAIVQITQELSALQNILESLLQLAEDEATPTTRLATLQSLCKADGPVAICKIELETLSATLNKEKSRWKTMRDRLMWPLKEAEVEKAVARIQNTRDTLQLALTTDQTKLLIKVHENVAALTEQIGSNNSSAQQQEIHTWLDAPDPFINHSVVSQKRLPSSGQWFVHGKPFEAWKEDQAKCPVFWLHGIPGAGKSVLSSTIIDHLFEDCLSQEAPLIYFYFDFNDTEKSTVDSLLRSLIWQLSVQCSTFPKGLEVSYQQARQRRHTAPTLDWLKAAFLSLLDLFGMVYIVIDALDECSEYDHFVKLLEDIELSTRCQTKLLVTSRRHVEIEEGLQPFTAYNIALQNASNQDIVTFVKDGMANDRRLARWPQDVQNDILWELIHRSHGMFRWVACQLDILRNCVTLKALRTALTTLPKTLYETYDRILLQVDEAYRQDVFRVLQWLAFARRSVTIAELVEVLAVDLEEQGSFDITQRIPNPQDVLLICSSLVTTFHTITHTSHLRLAHFTVKEYLLSPRLRDSKPELSYYALDPNTSHLTLARICLTYISSPVLNLKDPKHYRTVTRKSLPGLFARKLSKTYPLLDYAVLYWPQHIRKVDLDATPQAVELATSFFATQQQPGGGVYGAWVRTLIPDASVDMIERTHPLYYASSFGLTSIVKIILDTDPHLEIDRLGGRHQSSALHVASYRGHTEIVKLLLARGANPNPFNDLGESALDWALLRGYTDIRSLLLENGARSITLDKEELERSLKSETVENLQNLPLRRLETIGYMQDFDMMES